MNTYKRIKGFTESFTLGVNGPLFSVNDEGKVVVTTKSKTIVLDELLAVTDVFLDDTKTAIDPDLIYAYDLEGNPLSLQEIVAYIEDLEEEIVEMQEILEIEYYTEEDEAQGFIPDGSEVGDLKSNGFSELKEEVAILAENSEKEFQRSDALEEYLGIEFDENNVIDEESGLIYEMGNQIDAVEKRIEEIVASGLTYKPVDVRPEIEDAAANTVYGVKAIDTDGSIYRIEWMVVEGEWEEWGDTRISLEGYLTKEEADDTYVQYEFVGSSSGAVVTPTVIAGYLKDSQEKLYTPDNFVKTADTLTADYLKDAKGNVYTAEELLSGEGGVANLDYEDWDGTNVDVDLTIDTNTEPENTLEEVIE